MTGEPIEALKERRWAEVEAIDAALARGEIDESGWHRAMAALVVPSYLAGEDVHAQSGYGGDEAAWERARRLLAAAIDRDGAFLDVGCANGLLMESIVRWAAPHRLEPYGLEIAPELAALARRRLPRWAERIFVGNALGWMPPRRFDFVRTGLDYVPARRRPDLLAHLLEHVVEEDGRLIVGVFNEEPEPRLEREVSSCGLRIAGRTEAPHPSGRVVYRAFWIDAGARRQETS